MHFVHHDKLLLVIFCSNPKASVKMLLGFCGGNQGNANFQDGLQKYIITALLYTDIKTQYGFIF